MTVPSHTNQVATLGEALTKACANERDDRFNVRLFRSVMIVALTITLAALFLKDKDGKFAPNFLLYLFFVLDALVTFAYVRTRTRSLAPLNNAAIALISAVTPADSCELVRVDVDTSTAYARLVKGDEDEKNVEFAINATYPRPRLGFVKPVDESKLQKIATSLNVLSVLRHRP